MGRYSNPVALHDAQVRRFEAMNGDMRRGHQDLAIQGLKDMLDLTSGPIRSKTLAKMGHPFARVSKDPKSGLYNKKRGTRMKMRVGGKTVRMKAPLLPINVQTGRLRDSMRLRRVPGGVQAFEVGPTKSAGVSINVLRVGGTRNMVARGFWGEVKTRWKARNAAFYRVFSAQSKRP